MLRTHLCDLLGIDLPIILAGMGAGATSAEFAAAVSNQGAAAPRCRYTALGPARATFAFLRCPYAVPPENRIGTANDGNVATRVG